MLIMCFLRMTPRNSMTICENFDLIHLDLGDNQRVTTKGLKLHMGEIHLASIGTRILKKDNKQREHFDMRNIIKAQMEKHIRELKLAQQRILKRLLMNSLKEHESRRKFIEILMILDQILRMSGEGGTKNKMNKHEQILISQDDRLLAILNSWNIKERLLEILL